MIAELGGAAAPDSQPTSVSAFFMSANFISLDLHSIRYAIETSADQTNITCCVFLSYRFMITVFLESTNTRTNLVDARNASWG